MLSIFDAKSIRLIVIIRCCLRMAGRWLNGKPHGIGKLEWADGRMYTGQFHNGVIQGNGKMELPTQGIYEGQWKDGQQNGHGSFKLVTF